MEVIFLCSRLKRSEISAKALPPRAGLARFRVIQVARFLFEPAKRETTRPDKDINMGDEEYDEFQENLDGFPSNETDSCRNYK
jgi:hypothetical protein